LVSFSAPQSYQKWHYVPPNPGAPPLAKDRTAGTDGRADTIHRRQNVRRTNVQAVSRQMHTRLPANNARLVSGLFWHSRTCTLTLHLDNLSVAPANVIWSWTHPQEMSLCLVPSWNVTLHAPLHVSSSHHSLQMFDHRRHT